jgi:hypothetical protein
MESRKLNSGRDPVFVRGDSVASGGASIPTEASAAVGQTQNGHYVDVSTETHRPHTSDPCRSRQATFATLGITSRNGPAISVPGTIKLPSCKSRSSGGLYCVSSRSIPIGSRGPKSPGPRGVDAFRVITGVEFRRGFWRRRSLTGSLSAFSNDTKSQGFWWAGETPLRCAHVAERHFGLP